MMRRGVVELARSGDRGAFETLASSAIDRLFGAATLILHDRTLAEEAVQETLIHLWRDLPRLRDPDRFEPWMHRMLAHACLDLARREHRARQTGELPDWVSGGDEPEPGVIDRDTVRRGLARLSVRERSVLVLRFFLELSVPEIADAMQVPVGTVKSRLHGAEESMRAAIEADSRLSLQGGLA